MSEPVFEAYIHTADGRETLEIHEPVNALLIGAFLNELDKRGWQLPTPTVVDIKPFRADRVSILAKVACHQKGNPTDNLELNFAFVVSDDGKEVAISPQDDVVEGVSQNTYKFADLPGGIDINSFILLATARTGMLN